MASKHFSRRPFVSTVEVADGTRKTLSCPDAELTRQGIDEGDTVLWDGTALRKA